MCSIFVPWLAPILLVMLVPTNRRSGPGDTLHKDDLAIAGWSSREHRSGCQRKIATDISGWPRRAAWPALMVRVSAR